MFFVHSRDVQAFVSLHISCDPCILKLEEISPHVGLFFSCWRKVKFPQNIIFYFSSRKEKGLYRKFPVYMKNKKTN